MTPLTPAVRDALALRLGDRVRRSREARGLSAEDVAARCRVVAAGRVAEGRGWAEVLAATERNGGVLGACGPALDVIALAIGVTVAERDAWDAADGAIPHDLRAAFRRWPERASHARAAYGLTEDPVAHAASPWTPDPPELQAALEGVVRERQQRGDGKPGLDAANAERAWRYPCVAVTDHDRRMSMARGAALDAERLRDEALARVAALEGELTAVRRDRDEQRARAAVAETLAARALRCGLDECERLRTEAAS